MKPSAVKLLLLIIILHGGIISIAQKNSIRLFGGIGMQDMFHYGLDFQYSEKFKTSFSHGILYNNIPDEDADNTFKLRTYNWSNYYLFGKSKRFEGKTTFYVKQSLLYWKEIKRGNYHKYHWTALSLGKSFNLKGAAAINFEFGGMYNLKKESFSKKGNSRIESNGGLVNLDFLPTVELQLIIRLNKNKKAD